MSPLPAPRPTTPERSDSGRGIDIADALTSRQWEELTDVVMRRMERRMADELARRGRRVKPRVF